MSRLTKLIMVGTLFGIWLYSVNPAVAEECNAFVHHDFYQIDNRQYIVNFSVEHNAPRPAHIFIEFKMHYTSANSDGKVEEFVVNGVVNTDYMRSGESKSRRGSTNFDIQNLLFVKIKELTCDY